MRAFDGDSSQFDFSMFDILGNYFLLVFLRKHKIINPNYCTLYITCYTDPTKPYVLGLF